ncbi:hypothetical protein H0H92_015832 [Tricholoma furcatifolium]|nr:hypothetical protein H0H92_015832 [Tricholoma furcatifolium]
MENISVEPQDHSTHATRHPEKDVIPPHINYNKLTRAEKETANVRQRLKREREEEMRKEVDVFLEQRENFALQMAAKFDVKVEKAREWLNSAYVVKRQQKPSAFNAIVSYRAKELNDGLGKGERVPLEQVQEIVMQEMEDGKYDEDEIEAMKDKLAEHRELKAKGVRCSNRAAAVDHRATLHLLEEEMGNLQERVGTVGFAFFSRGHINDSIILGWIDSQGALGFVKDVLQTTPEELANKFELWACTRDKVETTGLSNVTMRYEKYDVDVVLKYGVVLKGWPAGVKFQSPAKITRIEDACILRDALLSGECHWVKLSRKEKKEREKDRRVKLASGEIAPKARKRRSDAGVKRGPRNGGKGEGKRKRGGDESASESDEDQDRENAAKSKRRRVNGTKDKASTARKLPPMPKSSEFVSSDESSNNDRE